MDEPQPFRRPTSALGTRELCSARLGLLGLLGKARPGRGVAAAGHGGRAPDPGPSPAAWSGQLVGGAARGRVARYGAALRSRDRGIVLTSRCASTPSGLRVGVMCGQRCHAHWIPPLA